MEKFKNRRELYYRGPKKGGIKKEDIFKMDHNFGVLLGASLGNRKTVERHYDLGGNLDAIDENGFPATVLASNSAQIEVVRLFLNKGADMSAKAPDGETALSVAVRKKKFNIARLLLKSIDDEEIISTVKVDTLNERKETPLFDAVRNNDTEMMELLLSYGASVDTVNKDGQIPLHVAAQDSRRQDALL
ncbi:MAG: ankyrin repeat domain-containing protein, partial [Clostridia bacterium]